MTPNHISKPRIISIDFIRIFVISLVLSSHVVCTDYFYASHTSGAVWMLSHVSRNLFLIITGFVLFYQHSDITLNPSSIWQFYKRRFPLIFIPYVAWSIIYQVQNGLYQHSIGDFLRVLGNNLIHGTACYHLYFLLLTMQIYLLFPLIVWAYRWVIKRIKPLTLLGISIVLQILIAFCIHQGYKTGTFIDWMFTDYDTKLIDYQLYVVIGLLMAENWTKLKQILLDHRLKIYFGALATVLFGTALYFIRIFVLGDGIVWASDVFQPYIVIESVVMMALLTTMGLRWVEKGCKNRRAIELIGEDSFGIYLSHIFILAKVAHLIQPHTSQWHIVLLGWIIGVPLTYGLAFCLSEILRRTPFSRIFTGRKSIFNQTWLYKKFSRATA